MRRCPASSDGKRQIWTRTWLRVTSNSPSSIAARKGMMMPEGYAEAAANVTQSNPGVLFLRGQPLPGTEWKKRAN